MAISNSLEMFRYFHRVLLLYTRLICVTEIGLPTREYRMTLKFNLKGLFLNVWMDQYENT